MSTCFLPNTLELNEKEASNKIEMKLEILWKQILFTMYQISERFWAKKVNFKSCTEFWFWNLGKHVTSLILD